MIIIGVDYSLKSPAFVAIDENGKPMLFGFRAKRELDGFDYKTYIDLPIEQKVSEKTKPMFYIQNRVFFDGFLSCLGISCKDVVVFIEGYSYWMAKNSASYMDLAENIGVLKEYLYLNQIQYEMVSPSAAKKALALTGNATKFEMIDAFEKEIGYDFYKAFGKERGKKRIPKPIDDIADAYAIAKYGYMKYYKEV